MLQNLIVTLGAGVAGMLLFILSAKGSLAAVLVTYFTPLPIMIAALGWSQTIGLAAALGGAALIAILFHPVLAAIYTAAFALPAWWLSYLALLARFDADTVAPQSARATVQREWYPVGKIVLWGAAISATAVILGVLSVSFNDVGFEVAARSAAAQILPIVETLFGPDRLPSGVTAQDIAAIAIRALPIAAAASLTLLHLVNLWLAGRTVELSRRLFRPWPDLPENLRLPRAFAAAFAIAVALAIGLEAYGALIAAIIAAAFGVALAAQGLAVLHALTRKRGARRAILAAAYGGIVLLMPWPLFLLSLVGLVDLVFPLRDRKATPASPTRNQ